MFEYARKIAFLAIFFVICASMAAGEEIEEVEVHAPPAERSAGVSISVITGEEIRNTTARTVGEALSFLPGVVVLKGTRKNRIRVSIRGFNPRYVRVFVDGVPLNSASNESVDLSTIPVEIIEKIEIIRGPAPVRYGSNAMAGVILITTKRGDQAPRLTVGADMHSAEGRDTYEEWMSGTPVESDGLPYYNTYTYDLALGLGNRRINAFSALNADLSDGYAPHSEYQRYNYWGRFGFMPTPWMEFTVMGSYFRGDQDLPNPDRQLLSSGSYAGGAGRGTGAMSNSRDWELRDWEKWHVAIDGRASVGNFNISALSYFYNDYYDLDVVKPGGPANTWRWSYVIGAQTSCEYEFRIKSLDNVIGAGFSYEHEHFHWANSVNPEALDLQVTQEAWAEVYGAYLEYVVESEHMVLTAGVRHDERVGANNSTGIENSGINGAEGVTSPNARILWKIIPNLSVHAAAARTYRFPRLRDTFDYVSGNPGLKPETAWDYELGINSQPAEWLTLKISGFRNDVDDLIYSPGKFIEFRNIGRARLWGFEAEMVAGSKFSYGPFRGLTGFSNYTYMDAYNLTDDRPVPYSPLHKVDVGLKIDLVAGFYTNIQYGWVSERTTDDAITEKLAPYDMMNVKIAWERKGKSIYAGVENVWDEPYSQVLGYPLAGRTWVAGTRLSF